MGALLNPRPKIRPIEVIAPNEAIGAKLPSLGVRVAATPAELARDVDVVLSCVGDDGAVEDVYFGAGELLKRVGRHTLIIELSTVAPETSQRLHEAGRELGISVLDVAVSFGVSNFDVKQVQRAQRIAPITSLQPQYSLVATDVAATILPYVLSQQIGVIVSSPMGSGLLTGAMTRERIAAMPGDDWRKRDPNFQEPLFSRNLRLVETLRSVGQTPRRESGRSRDYMGVEKSCRHGCDCRRPQRSTGKRDCWRCRSALNPCRDRRN